MNVVHAAPLLNGGFEDDTSNGWTTGEGYRGGVPNSAISPAAFLPGGTLYAGPGTLSAGVGWYGRCGCWTRTRLDRIFRKLCVLGARDGQRWIRIGYQPDGVVLYRIEYFFAWKAVLENGGHTEEVSAEMIITLTDNTTNTLLISRGYDAGVSGGGVDTRFSEMNGIFYTPDWQIEQLSIDSALAGHDFALSLLAADCDPTGHFEYVYIDGFGEVSPPSDVPEPQRRRCSCSVPGAC